MTPLHAWFTLQGDLVGVSGVPVRLVAGQAVDPTAWYSASGHRVAIAGPFHKKAMNKQGYLRGSQILAAEKLALAARRPGQPGATAQALAQAPVGGLKLLDWMRVPVGSSATGQQLGEWSPAATQPSGVMAVREATLEGAGRFGKAGKVRFLLGANRLHQIIAPTRTTPPSGREAGERYSEATMTSLDVTVGIVERLGTIGLSISTVCVVVDTAGVFHAPGSNSVLDGLAWLGGTPAPGLPAGGALSHLGKAAAGHTRGPMPGRGATGSLAEHLRQTPLAAHNAVFQIATG